MIIIEGPDNSGKTTLINSLRKQGLNNIVTTYHPKDNAINFYINTSSVYQNLIVERHYLSELVYSSFKKDRTKYSSYFQYIIESSILSYFPIILYLRPPIEEIYKNFKKEGDPYINESEIEHMVKLYDEIMNKSVLSVIKYDYTQDNLNKIFTKVLNEHNNLRNKAIRFHQFLSSGDYRNQNSLMIIKESIELSDINNLKIKPYSNHDVETMIFFNRLNSFGFLDKKIIPYITTYNKGYKYENEMNNAIKQEINLLKPKHLLVDSIKLLDKIPNSKLFSVELLDKLKNEY